MRRFLYYAWSFCMIVWLVVYFYMPYAMKPDKNGMIHHPFYGTYPAEIEFHDGMSLMPGQSARFYIGIPTPTR